MKYINAFKILKSEGNIENLNSLLTKKTLQIGYHEKDLVTFKGKTSVMLDFGKEISGGVRILTHSANKNAKLHLRFGESVSEANSEIDVKNSTNDHSTRDFVVDIQSWSDLSFGQTGFRFLQINTLDDMDDIAIKTIVASVDIDEREEVGKLECDDEIVNKIWQTASYTLRLCLKNGYFWDGIKRDRLVWIGDLYPEMKSAGYLYENCPETLNSIDFAVNETPLPLWVADMPAYSLWLLIILYEEYYKQGDKNIILPYINYIDGLVKQIAPFVEESGKTCYPFNFIDWPSQPTDDNKQVFEENLAGMSYLTKIAITRAKEMLELFEKDISLCNEILGKLCKKQWENTIFRQVAALGVLSGDNNETNKKTVLNGHTKGISTFMSYIVLSAMSSLKNIDEAFSIMKEYYNGMLSIGATTFFEDFNLEWLNGSGRIDEFTPEGKKDFHGDHGAFCYKGFRHSLCHGWSAGIIAWIVENVMGIKFTKKGQKQMVITPQIATLKWAKITIPTKFGPVTVKHSQDKENKVTTTFNAPRDIEIIVNNK